MVYLGPNLISWSSHKQPTVSRSTTEAEYRSVANTTSKLEWIKMVLGELKIKVPDAMVIWCDNSGAIALSKNPILHIKSKHFGMNFHFMRERVMGKTLSVKFGASKDQRADLLTKALSRSPFQYLSSILTIELPLSLRGRIEDNYPGGQTVR